jgi:hypothetical protein
MIAVLAGIADAIAYTNRCLLEAIVHEISIDHAGFSIYGLAVIRPLRTATRRSWQPGGFGDSCLPDGIFHGTLDYRFVEVMPTPDAGLAVDVVTAWRKNPLPTPLAVGIRIRALDGMGERHAARSRGKIPFV